MRKVFPKELVFIVAVAALLLVLAAFWPPVSIPQVLILFALVLMCVALSLLLQRLRAIAQSYRAVVRRYTNLALSSSRRIEQLQADLQTISSMLSDFQQERDLHARNADSFGSTGVRPIFDPQLVPPLAIESRPNAMEAGRIAAEQVSAGDAYLGYKQLFSPVRIGVAHRIAIVGISPLIDIASEYGEVQVVMPGDAHLRPGTSYLVIDELACCSGAWAGLSGTPSTALFRQLNELATKSIRNGVVVVFVPSPIPDHFSGELREVATVVFDRENLKEFSKDTSLPFVRAMAKSFDTGERS